MFIIDIDHGSLDDHRLAILFDDRSVFKQGVALERVTDAIAIIVRRDILAQAVLLAFGMVKADDPAFINGEAFMRRKVRRCPADRSGCSAVAF